MAVRNTGGDNGLQRTSGLPSSTAFTIVGRSRLTEIITTGYAFLGGLMVSNTQDNYILIGWFNDVLSVSTTGNNNTMFTTAPTVDQPFSWALRCGGTGSADCVGYICINNSVERRTVVGASFTPNNLMVGNDTLNQPAVGSYDEVIVWDANLTDEEVILQLMSLGGPKCRLDKVHLYSPLSSALDVRDYSGNARDWAILGALVSAEGIRGSNVRRIEQVALGKAPGSDASSAPSLDAAATGAALKAADASAAPTLNAAATGASLAAGAPAADPSLNAAATGASLGAGAPSAAPTIDAAATSAALKEAAGSSAPTLDANATGASLAAGAPSSAPTLNGTATGAALGAGAPSAAPTLDAAATSGTGSDAVSSPTLDAAATGAALKAADASATPTLDAAATSQGGSAADSAPSLNAAATGASLAAGAPSSAPTISAGATGASMAAAAPSCLPTFDAAPVGAVLYAATPSSAPSLDAGATGAVGPRPQSDPTLNAAATGAALAAGDPSSAPSLNAAATSGGGGDNEDEWHPDWDREGWRADYYAEQ